MIFEIVKSVKRKYKNELWWPRDDIFFLKLNIHFSSSISSSCCCRLGSIDFPKVPNTNPLGETRTLCPDVEKSRLVKQPQEKEIEEEKGVKKNKVFCIVGLVVSMSDY